MSRGAGNGKSAGYGRWQGSAWCVGYTAGAGTPIVAGDRVFVSALDKASKKLLAMCLSQTDGKILWSKEVGEGFQQNNRNNMASPSAVAGALTSTATTGKVTGAGTGSPNRLLQSLLTGGGTTPTEPPPGTDCDETVTGSVASRGETVATSFSTTGGRLTG